MSQADRTFQRLIDDTQTEQITALENDAKALRADLQTLKERIVFARSSASEREDTLDSVAIYPNIDRAKSIRDFGSLEQVINSDPPKVLEIAFMRNNLNDAKAAERTERGQGRAAAKRTPDARKVSRTIDR